MPEEGRVVLQRLLADHKVKSGRPWRDFGPTLRGWHDNGVPDKPHPGTLLQVDALFGWDAGTAWAVFNGDRPPSIDHEDKRPTGRPLVETLEALAEALEIAHQSIQAAIQDLRDAQ